MPHPGEEPIAAAQSPFSAPIATKDLPSGAALIKKFRHSSNKDLTSADGIPVGSKRAGMADLAGANRTDGPHHGQADVPARSSACLPRTAPPNRRANRQSEQVAIRRSSPGD